MFAPKCSAQPEVRGFRSPHYQPARPPRDTELCRGGWSVLTLKATRKRILTNPETSQEFMMNHKTIIFHLGLLVIFVSIALGREATSAKRQVRKESFGKTG